ncbi:acyl-protein thioesterase 1 [Naviculisporaceae sp. PSN 640]
MSLPLGQLPLPSFAPAHPIQQDRKGKQRATIPPLQRYNTEFRPCYIVKPRERYPHTHTIIFLHGLGSTAEEFASELFESEASPAWPPSRNLPQLLPTVKWVFPRAPILRSERFDEDMSQWFDIWSVEDPSQRPELQVPGLQQSIEYIHSVIDLEAALVDGGRSKIFLAGISQGFATALAAFYATPSKWGPASGSRALAGLIGISSWLPFAQPLSNCWSRIVEISNAGNAQRGSPAHLETTVAMANTPVLLQHCEDDGVVPVESIDQMTDAFRWILMRGETIVYKNGGHWVNEPLGVDDFARFVWKYM